jgi:hypothetical protein
MRYAVVLLFSAALTCGIGALSRVPYSAPDGDMASLRFSWRMNVAGGETCRPRTQAELDELPVHMRSPEVCTREVARYTLITTIGDAAPDTTHLVRGGVRGDRPLFVLDERTLSPGAYRVRAELVRATSSSTRLTAVLDTTLALRAGRVQLITLDPGAQRLVAVPARP